MVLPLCRLAAEERAQAQRAVDDMTGRGLRILALAWRELPEAEPRESWEGGLALAGLVGLEDPPRLEVPGAIEQCRRAGIRVIMVTGDHPHTAEAVARAIGLAPSGRPAVLLGEDVARMSDAQLQLALEAAEILFARVSAEQKLRIVAALQRKGHVAAATGDGVNDAPALRAADIGIAMGVVGTDVARAAADMILLDDNLASIVAAIEEGRAVFDNTRKFLTYILTSDVPELVPYLAFVLAHPVAAHHRADPRGELRHRPRARARARRRAPPAPGTMARPPRPRSTRLLDGKLLVRAYLWLGLLEAIAALAAYFFVLRAGGWHYGEVLAPADPLYLQATTACLAAIVVAQVANLLACRDLRRSAFALGFSNPLIAAGIAFELALLVLPFAAALLLLEEGRKLVLRRRA